MLRAMWPRQCVRLNVRLVLAILLSVVMNGVLNSGTSAQNSMHLTAKPEQTKNSTNLNNEFLTIINQAQPIDFSMCAPEMLCSQLPVACIVCTYNHSCTYGRELQVNCEVRKPVTCDGVREFQRNMSCRYCWQTEPWEHTCTQKDSCNSANHHFVGNCTVHPDLLCLGKRSFQKRLRCNWTQGYRWSTALVISVTLGGFGADRFYLGHWQEGIGKLFSFGGLGVWTLIDVILISLHYLGPADGSLYL